jgi:hypothetical protein
MSRSIYIPLGGGLNLSESPRQVAPGTALSCINYECPVTGGYRRIDGYTQLGPVVPGQGPLLGVATFYDRHYAIREDAIAGTATLYRLSADELSWEVIGAGGELSAARHEFDEGNAYATEAGNALYGVGGGKPFELTQDGTLTVLAGAPSGALMIALHRNHLFLGFRAGSLQFSGIGDPANWDAATGGAGEVGVGQRLTGIVKGVGGVLHVLCRNDIQTLYFSSAEDLRLEVTVPGAGARSYSAQSLMAPYFVGERGITTLQAAQEFGDFSALQPGKVVEPLFAEAGLADRVAASSVSKAKAQYRVFFDNGSALYVSPNGITQVQLPIQVAVTHSGEFLGGEESLLMGDVQGGVYRLDYGNDFNGAPVRAFLTLAFTDLKSPSTRKRFRRAFWDIRSGSEARIWIQPDFDYGDNQTGRPRRSPIDFMLGGGLWGVDSWGEFNWSVPFLGQEALDVSGTGASINFAIFSESSSAPHELLGYDLHFDVRRTRRG